MKISAKGRYALAAMITMAAEYVPGVSMTLPVISKKLGISKIYLEQVFALLRRAELVLSIKGSRGGYQLARTPRDITALDVLSAVELSLFEGKRYHLIANEPAIERAMETLIIDTLNQTISYALRQTTLEDLVVESEKNKGEDGLMFFI